MESDSDSDGSHVSAIPPRQANPPPPPPTPPPKPPLLVPNKHRRIRIKPSKPKPLPSKPHQSHSKPDPVEPDPLSLPSTPFQIRHHSNSVPASSTSHSIENLPAGLFSKSASFSKIRRPILNLESSTNEPVCNSDTRNSKKLEKKKHLNLIGASVPMSTVKLRKSSGGGGGEGDFLKLNLGGRKRKSMKMGWKKNRKFGWVLIMGA